jgi:hypothetical protein
VVVTSVEAVVVPLVVISPVVVALPAASPQAQSTIMTAITRAIKDITFFIKSP